MLVDSKETFIKKKKKKKLKKIAKNDVIYSSTVQEIVHIFQNNKLIEDGLIIDHCIYTVGLVNDNLCGRI